jgi:hypothetical protein
VQSSTQSVSRNVFQWQPRLPTSLVDIDRSGPGAKCEKGKASAPVCLPSIGLLSWSQYSFLLFSCGGVRLSPRGTSATNWPIVPAPYDRWRWVWSSRWNENWQRKLKYFEKTCPSATLSTTNPTRPDLGSNPSRRGGKPATNRLSYGTAIQNTVISFISELFTHLIAWILSCFVR